MGFELRPQTDSGTAFVELCEKHAEDFATRADEHDRAGSFPFENYEAMRASGLTGACVPRSLGGLGVTSLHDLTVGIERLGRGDGSTAIAINMHHAFTWMMARTWADPAMPAGLRGVLEMFFGQVTGEGLITAILSTEPGTLALFHPLCEARRVDGGWSINGTKIFGTLSPVAGLFLVPLWYRWKDGRDWVGYAWVPRGTAGMTINDDWEALGMRATGSNSVRFADCMIPETSLMPLGLRGEWTRDTLTTGTAGNISLVGAFLGIAESAHAWTVDMLKTRRKAPSNTPLGERPALQRLTAESEIDLAASRAMLSRTAIILDEFFDTHPARSLSVEALHPVMKDFQATKTFVQRKAIEVVDRCLQASGGSGYMGRSTLARQYRDVRAGPFMQPFSPNEAYEYIGRVALGLDPMIDL